MTGREAKRQRCKARRRARFHASKGVGATCPTCIGVARGRCCSCGAVIMTVDQWLRENPYQAEVNADHRTHLMCGPCRSQALADI
jgi:hypothetical protein